jgi:hypothetical protein
MKKILNKIRRKKTTDVSSRITSETIAEHREQILAGGRRFKYPLQYSRHKLVFNTIIISVASLIIILVIGWWQLYKVQNTSEFMYRITKVLPVSIARVDGQPVRYSDYLMRYRSSAHYLEQKEQVNLRTDDGKRQVEYIKQQAMDDAVADAYADKLAQSLGITVNNEELEEFLKFQRQSDNSGKEISQQAYDAVILDYYNWSSDEYRHVMKSKLLKQKVAYQLDKKAAEEASFVNDKLKSTSSFQEIVASFNIGSGILYGTSGWVPKTNQDGGLTTAAKNLEKGGVSDLIKPTTGNGYYCVRLLDISNTQLNYEYIHIPLTKFLSRLEQVKKDNKIKQFISIEKITTDGSSDSSS